MVYLALPETCQCHSCFVLWWEDFIFFTFTYSFSGRGGGGVWIVFVANVQPEKNQLLIMDEFHGTQKVKERRNTKE